MPFSKGVKSSTSGPTWQHPDPEGRIPLYPGFVALLPAISLLLALQANPTGPVMVAVTESGRAIEAIEASPGDLELTTPFGVFACPTDAVERVEDRTLLRNRFLKLLEEEAISRRVLTHEASAAGLPVRLMLNL